MPSSWVCLAPILVSLHAFKLQERTWQLLHIATQSECKGVQGVTSDELTCNSHEHFLLFPHPRPLRPRLPDFLEPARFAVIERDYVTMGSHDMVCPLRTNICRAGLWIQLGEWMSISPPRRRDELPVNAGRVRDNTDVQVRHRVDKDATPARQHAAGGSEFGHCGSRGGGDQEGSIANYTLADDPRNGQLQHSAKRHVYLPAAYCRLAVHA